MGIDWVSAGIFFAAYVFAQVKAVPLRARFAVLGVACALIGLLRLRLPNLGLNLVFTGAAFALAAYYGYRALRAPPPP